MGDSVWFNENPVFILPRYSKIVRRRRRRSIHVRTLPLIVVLSSLFGCPCAFIRLFLSIPKALSDLRASGLAVLPSHPLRSE